jgi:ribonuclease D
VLSTAARQPDATLPAAAATYDGPPPARAWAERNPAAAERLAQARADLAVLAEQHQLPVENLLTPDTLRRVLWEPPEASAEAVADALRGLGARPWQVALTAPVVLAAMTC